MISHFHIWLNSNKNDKLDLLRTAVIEQDEALQRANQRYDRLMAYLALVEVDGPRIERIPLTPTGERGPRGETGAP